MSVVRVSLIFLVVFVATSYGAGRSNEMRGMMDSMRNARQSNGGQQGMAAGNPSSRGGRDWEGSSNKYRTNLFNDDDVYGYDANYPGGQAMYISYRNPEARSRRGPEFARTSRYSSGGGSKYGNSRGQGVESN